MKDFIWRNRFGEKIPLLGMDTNYLYNTVKMIWNNVIAPENSFGDVIFWEFDNRNYPPEYLREVLRFGISILRSRNEEISRAFVAHVDTVLEANYERNPLEK